MLRILFFLLFTMINAEEKKSALIIAKTKNYAIKKNLIFTSIFAKDDNLEINIVNAKDNNLINVIKAKKPDFIITYENLPEIQEAISEIKDKKTYVLTFDDQNVEKDYIKILFSRKENISFFLKNLSKKGIYNLSVLLPETKIGHSYMTELMNFKKKKSKASIRDALFYNDLSTFTSSLKKIYGNYYENVARDLDENVIIYNHREKKKRAENFDINIQKEKLDGLYILIDEKNSENNFLEELSKSLILEKNINIIIDTDKAYDFLSIDSAFYDIYFTGLNFPYLNSFNQKFYDKFNFAPNDLSYNFYDLIAILTKYDLFEFKKDMFFSGILSEKIEFSSKNKTIKKINMNFYKYNINDKSFINHDI